MALFAMKTNVVNGADEASLHQPIMNLLSASPDVASELMRLLSAAGAKTAQTPKNVSK